MKYDARDGVVFVTRAILCHGHESADRGGNVIETREIVRWVRELVGTVRLATCPTRGAFVDELACLQFQAVVGTSRLPLTSLEAPLPVFALGQLGFVYRPETSIRAKPLRVPRDLLPVISDPNVARVERVRLVELCLRAADPGDLTGIAEAIVRHADSTDRFAMLREMFNGVTLSPYTDFAAKALAVPRIAASAGLASAADAADFYSHLLRQLSRHLTAYDLVTFHHRGANYPDALLLDDILREIRPLATPPAGSAPPRATVGPGPSRGVRRPLGSRRADLARRECARVADTICTGPRRPDLRSNDAPPAPVYRRCAWRR